MTTRVIDLHLAGTHAALPAAATTPKGALYACSTHGLIYLNDGLSWNTGTPWLTTGSVGLTDANVAPVAPNDQTGTTYTFVLADSSRLVTGSNAAVQTFTIPPNSSVAYPLGTALQLYQKGTAQITLAAGAGVTLRTPRGAKTAVQHSLAQAVQVVADVWVIGGDVTT